MTTLRPESNKDICHRVCYYIENLLLEGSYTLQVIVIQEPIQKQELTMKVSS